MVSVHNLLVGAGRTKRMRAPIMLLVLIGLLLAATGRSVSAHGEDRTLQLSDAVAGPFRLTVWTAPAILRSGEIHVETAVLGADGVPRRDVLVQVTVSPRGQRGRTLTALARPMTATNGVIQEAAFTLRQPGAYLVTVTVQGPDGASGQASFPVDVVHVAPAVKLGLHALMIASVLASIWVLREGLRIWFGGGRHVTPQMADEQMQKAN